jgi:hypothetical protein
LILAHRGNLEGPQSTAHENTLDTLMAAVDAGFGIETDFRADGTKLVLSHDPAPWSEERDATTLLSRLDAIASHPNERRRMHAFNVKDRDGLHLLLSALQQLPALRRSCFLFDFELVFTPDEAEALMADARNVAAVAQRASDREPELERLLQLGVKNVWLDEFDEIYATGHRIQAARAADVSVYCVSPDLHGAADIKVIANRWIEWRTSGATSICTDYARLLAKHLETP